MKKLLTFGFIAVLFLLLGCLDGLEHPNYPDEPEISFNDLTFIETPAVGTPDNLKLTIDYKDGDMDLGLSYDDVDYPYHDVNYFLADGAGDTTKVTTTIWQDAYEAYLLLVVGGNTGKLVTEKTRLTPNYSYLPEYNPESCLNYANIELLVPEYYDVIDNTYNIVDTIYDGLNNRGFIVEEPILYSRNENHYNIFVEFFYFENDVWTEYNWFENFCIDFNGRFPVLGNRARTVESGPFEVLMKSPYEGKIIYNMEGWDLKAVFGNKALKLRISIKDRALHDSNIIETPPFTLSGS